MYEFQHIWAFVLLPAPLLLAWLVPAYRERQESVRIPFFDDAVRAAGREPTRGAVVLRRNLLQWIIAPLAWALIVTALARPVFVEPPIERIESARDLLIAVDLSGSMETTDMFDADGNRIDRLEAIKLVLDDFIARREGDRIALLVFGTAPYLQAPFTQDHDLVREMLTEAEVAMPGPQTMLGDALGLAIKTFEASEAEARVVLLLTDGNDTGSKVPPEKAASIAADNGITVHTIGFGDPRISGEDLFDGRALEVIASATGGQAFMAEDREALENVYRQLDEIEPRAAETLSYRPTRPLYMWPLGAALVLVLLYHLIMGVGASIPRRHSQEATGA